MARDDQNKDKRQPGWLNRELKRRVDKPGSDDDNTGNVEDKPADRPEDDK